MEPKIYNMFENPRMYKYQNTLKEIQGYLEQLFKERTEKDKQGSKDVLENFPNEEPKTPEEYHQFFLESLPEWLDVYDNNILYGYSQQKAKSLHDPELCIPCHIGIPKNQPLFIQYLYCLQKPDDPNEKSVRRWHQSSIPEENRTMQYEKILKGVNELTSEDREKFLYELRLGFLETATEGEDLFNQFKKLKSAGPEEFYKGLFEDLSDDETKNMYNQLVQIAHNGDLHDFDNLDEDYVVQTGSIFEDCCYYFHTAFYQLQMMRDLIKQKLDTSPLE